MLRSLFSGISGLKAHQEMMDVVSNNIANVNTVGYKTSNTVFEDTLSQMIRASGAPTDQTGGVNPTQIGLGVQLAAVQTNFAQGSTQITNKPTDCLIQGDGFFVLKNGGNTMYTRAGAFTLDTDGYLVNPDGAYVQGYAATNGVVDSFGTLSNLRLPTGTSIPGSATTTVDLGGNLSPTGTNTLTATATVYDQNGAAYQLPVQFTPDSPADGGYQVAVLDPADNTNQLGTGNIAFDAAGKFDPTNSTNPITVTVNGATMNVDLSGMTGYAGLSSPTVTSTDGYSSGTLTQFQIGSDGVITGIFSNDQKQDLGQIAVATFNNPAGLQKEGDSDYISSSNSGLAEVGVPNSSGRGTIVSGALEMSNVDLATEFTNLIIAQRGFSANAKVITTSDDMLQDLVNIKQG